MQDLTHLADLIHVSNFVNGRISQIIGRPANIGALGEYIASRIFDIELHENAVTKASDGTFRLPTALAGRSVNIKFYSRMGGLLDMATSVDRTWHPDYYLVMSGPIPKSATTKGTQAPLVIDRIYLFDVDLLLSELLDRPKPVKPGIATSIRKHIWEAAMIYPTQINQSLILSEEQRRALRLFAAPG